MADHRPPATSSAGEAPRHRRRPGPDQLAGALLVVIGAVLLSPVIAPAPPWAAPAAPSTDPPGSVAAAATASPSPAWTMAPELAALVGRPRPTDHAGDTLPATPAPTEPPPTSPPAEELTGYRWPMDGGRVTTWFQPVDGGFVVVDGERVHDGIDIATFCGDYILAAHDGVVLYAGRTFDPFLGHDASTEPFYARLAEKQRTKKSLPIVVVIDDGNGYRSLYAHLSEATVEAGQMVSAGQLIGLEGATGHATGCHLHYGLVRMDGAYVPIARELVKKWHYPERTRERIDPLRVFDLTAADAPREVPGRPPPKLSPGYGPTAPLLGPKPTVAADAAAATSAP